MVKISEMLHLQDQRYSNKQKKGSVALLGKLKETGFWTFFEPWSNISKN